MSARNPSQHTLSPVVPPPMSLLAELTHRCPLSCPYCSNPLQLEKKGQELSSAVWKKILEEAAEIGVLQAHFSGGEPMARHDLAELIAHAHKLNLYTNLITSGIFITDASLAALDKAGLDHIQLSFQDVAPAEAEHMSGFKNVQPRKLEAARLIQRSGIPLTFNFVLQRHNLTRIPEMFALAREYGVHRIEMAHTQYYGWAFKNYAALLPSREQLAEAEKEIDKQRALGGMIIDYVTPDYYADRPKPCMGGWGQRFINVSPSGRVLPCHAAESIPGLVFPVFSSDLSLRQIWEESEPFRRFRGTDWMPEPCASCDRKMIDWGGCRCQALALTGDATATDPVCSLSPHRSLVDTLIAKAEHTAKTENTQPEQREKLLYRHFSS